MKWLLAALVLGVSAGCLVDPPDVDDELFACFEGDDCIDGYHCEIESDGLGICRPDGGVGASGSAIMIGHRADALGDCQGLGCPQAERCVYLFDWDEWICKRTCANVGNPCAGYATPNQCQDVDGWVDGGAAKVNVCVACDEPSCQGGEFCDIDPDGPTYHHVAGCL